LTNMAVTPLDLPCLKNPLLHTNLMALFFIESELSAIEVYIAGIGIFDFFCSYEPDLDVMTFMYEFDAYSLEIHSMCKSELSTSRLLKAIVWQTDRQRSYSWRWNFGDHNKTKLWF